MAYALKIGGQVMPLTRLVDPQVLIEGGRNTILYEQDERVTEGIFRLFATNHSPESSAGSLRDQLCCLPRVDAPAELVPANFASVPVNEARGNPARAEVGGRGRLHVTRNLVARHPP